MVYALPFSGRCVSLITGGGAGVCVCCLMASDFAQKVAGRCFQLAVMLNFTWGSMRHPFCAYFLRRRCAANLWNGIIFSLSPLAFLVVTGRRLGLGVGYRKKVAEREIGSAEAEATRLINEAIRSGENRKKEMLLEAKDEIHKSRTEHDKEVKERRAELSKQERRLEQKEATLDKKTEAFERKEEELAKRLQKVSETQAQADQLKQQQLTELEKISGLTQDRKGFPAAQH